MKKVLVIIAAVIIASCTAKEQTISTQVRNEIEQLCYKADSLYSTRNNPMATQYVMGINLTDMKIETTFMQIGEKYLNGLGYHDFKFDAAVRNTVAIIGETIYKIQRGSGDKADVKIINGLVESFKAIYCAQLYADGRYEELAGIDKNYKKNQDKLRAEIL